MQSAGADSLLSLVTDRYEAYAPSDEELEVVVAGLERAVNQFARYMGEAPPMVAFVLHETGAQREAYSQERLGVPVYAISNRRRDMDRITMFPEMGLILDGDQGRTAVIRATFDGSAPEIDLRQGDEIVGANEAPLADLGELIEARQHWQEGDDVTLRIERGGDVVEERFTFPGRGAAREPPADALARASAFTPSSARARVSWPTNRRTA